MKRDMNLIRLLLIQREGEEEPDLSEYSTEDQVYHGALLIEAGLVHGSISEGEDGDPSGVYLTRLTWEGHEFLDAARSETVWKKVRAATVKGGVGLTLPIAKALLAKYAKEKLGLDL